jgi:hypothetical protein
MIKGAIEPKPTRKGKSNVPLRLLQLKVSLNGTKVWRRFIVPNFFSLFDLHDVLQIIMGWENSHPALFTVGNRMRSTCYVCDTFDDFGDIGDIGEDADKCDLTYLTEKKMKLCYEYDFGDSWKHNIVVENPDVDYNGDVPVVLDGKLNCPPEDCGGVWGYENLLELLKDPSKDEDGILEWVGDYDPDEFSIEKINAELTKRFKPKKKAVKKKASRGMWVFTGKTESSK